MKKVIEIIRTTIYDHTIYNQKFIDLEKNDGFGVEVYDVSDVYLGVEFTIAGHTFNINFQTSDTIDYGAISLDLMAYTDDDEYDKFAELFDDEYERYELLEKVKSQANVWKVWADYVDKYFIRNTNDFGGIDANSVINEMTKSLKNDNSNQ